MDYRWYVVGDAEFGRETVEHLSIIAYRDRGRWFFIPPTFDERWKNKTRKMSASSTQTLPRFEDYKVNLHTGRTHWPKWIRKVSADEWRDNLDKLVGAPEINFAGKYFVSVHSCGTGCRYYTMTDLSNRRELDVLKAFDAGEPAPKTRAGHTYITDLVTRPNSKLLIAQYWISLPGGDKCSERAFLFNGHKLKPITSTRSICTVFESTSSTPSLIMRTRVSSEQP